MKYLATAILTLALCGCGSNPSLPSFGVVPDFKLTDQLGRTFDSSKSLEGKVWVADFIFTTCAGPCPRMTSQLRKLRNDIGQSPELRLVSFTIDPARDTPEALATYGQQFGADPEKWFFLTGAQKDLHHLSRNVFMLGDVDGSLEHSSRFILIDRHSRIRGFYDTSDAESLQKLASDLHELLKGSA